MSENTLKRKFLTEVCKVTKFIAVVRNKISGKRERDFLFTLEFSPAFIILRIEVIIFNVKDTKFHYR
jgi:hypothetical protein